VNVELLPAASVADSWAPSPSKVPEVVARTAPDASRLLVDVTFPAASMPGPGDRLGADEPDQHVAAARHRQLRRQAGPRPPRQRERDIGERFGQRRGAPGERRGQPRDLLGKRGLRAPGVDALEPADLHDHQRPAAAGRKAGELTLVAGVNPGRAPAASRARRIARLPPDPERHQIPAVLDAIHRGGSELRQKRINVL